MKIKSFIYGFVSGSLLSGIATMMTTSLSGKERQNQLKNAYLEVKAPINELKDSAILIANSIKNVQHQAQTYIPSVITSINESIQHYKDETIENQQRLQSHLEEMERNISAKK